MNKKKFLKTLAVAAAQRREPDWPEFFKKQIIKLN